MTSTSTSTSTITLPVNTVCCTACGHDIDAATADLCSCINAQASFVCSHCGVCLCRSVGAMKLFLRTATTEIQERYERERVRRRSLPEHSNGVANVLVVDDDEEIRDIAAFMIANMGCRVSTARGAEEALNMIETEAPDVVFTDALMPRTDGRTLCRLIKAINPRIKVAIMTSLYTAPRYRSEAFRLFHADAYLAKPIDSAVVRKVLNQLTDGRVEEGNSL